MMAAEVEDGGGGRRWWQTTTMATADNNNGNGRRQQQQMTTAADDNGTRDWAVDYKGERGERAANNNGIRARQAESMKNKEIKFTHKTVFSNTVCPVQFSAPAKTPNGIF
jgi:hypothetical protein